MYLCPDCRKEFHADQNICSWCGWKKEEYDGVQVFLSTKDANDPQFASYRGIYDTLADKNSKKPSEGNVYIEHLAKRFVANLGDVADKDVCDVGSGRGFFIKHVLNRKPRSVTAVDIAGLSLKHIVDTYSVAAVQANAENLPFQNQFDVISATDILEHVLNVSNFMLTANWALRQGGTLAIRVPYKESLIYYSKFFGLPFPYAHLRSFNKELLVDTVHQYGFKVSAVHYDGFRSAILQDVWNKVPSVGRRLTARIQKHFPDEDEVAGINPFIGRLLMKPIEITVIARKVMDVPVKNVYENYLNY
ncbi:class I SAM-dependent methyltransferase [Caenispirillum bisanense]|uniref:class I SAM-dependent methyltransferase n=1 Tax=Caenispirillum bisanense TaxID=414052 RepID=UPI0031DC9BF6